MEAAGSGGTAKPLAWILLLAFTTGPAEVFAYMPAFAWRSGMHGGLERAGPLVNI
ncbi:MAG TPA: hypothetical protein VFN71_10405 [Methylomirabilota bacterium]|nr:hypothetical protein [Methylomirabilota bacterium]